MASDPPLQLSEEEAAKLSKAGYRELVEWVLEHLEDKRCPVGVEGKAKALWTWASANKGEFLGKYLPLFVKEEQEHSPPGKFVDDGRDTRHLDEWEANYVKKRGEENAVLAAELAARPDGNRVILDLQEALKDALKRERILLERLKEAGFDPGHGAEDLLESDRAVKAVASIDALRDKTSPVAPPMVDPWPASSKPEGPAPEASKGPKPGFVGHDPNVPPGHTMINGEVYRYER